MNIEFTDDEFEALLIVCIHAEMGYRISQNKVKHELIKEVLAKMIGTLEDNNKQELVEKYFIGFATKEEAIEYQKKVVDGKIET